MKKNHTLSITAKRELMNMPVISVRDYRKLLTRAVQEYALMGYVLMTVNVLRGDRNDYIPMRRGKDSAVISTSTADDKSIANEAVTMMIQENGRTVFSRMFYEYSSDHAHAHNKSGYGRQYYSTRPCASKDERDKMRSMHNDRCGAEDKDAPVYNVYSALTTPRWNDIVRKLLPVIRSVKGYRTVTASKVEHITLWKRHALLDADGVYQTKMVARIHIEGKNKDITFCNSYYVPKYYEDAHGVKNKGDRVCVHGFYLPSSYAPNNNSRGRDANMRVSYLLDEDGEHDRTMGYVAVCRHPFYGNTYAVLDSDGSPVANGYIPADSNAGYSAFLCGKQPSAEDEGIIPLILKTERGVLPKKFHCAKAKEFEYFDYQSRRPLLLGMVRYWENTDESCDLAAYDRKKRNSQKEVEFRNENTVSVCGITLTLKSCEMTEFGWACVSAVGGADNNYEIRFAVNKNYVRDTYNGEAKIIHEGSPYVYETFRLSRESCKNIYCFAEAHR